jgi:phytoene dehydrogenase-like protein
MTLHHDFKVRCYVMWPPEFPAMFILMTLAWMHQKTSGYPIGGSLPFARAIERRYLNSGGKINYKAKVTRIMVENGRAVGIKQVDGSEHRADYVISASDGHSTIFDMLEGKYCNNKIKGYYDSLPTFSPLIFIGLGVNRSFEDMPNIISGIEFPLEKSIMISGKELTRLNVRIHNFDPTLAPPGKTVITCMIPTEYTYWKSLGENSSQYKAEKEQIVDMVISALDKRFPGLALQVEMKDMATPVTFHRYTGNWKGSFEGWMITPKTWNLRMSKTLPGLDNFYMAGQWVEPGGGLPTSIMSGRNVIQILCKRDKKAFITTIP